MQDTWLNDSWSGEGSKNRRNAPPATRPGTKCKSAIDSNCWKAKNWFIGFYAFAPGVWASRWQFFVPARDPRLKTPYRLGAAKGTSGDKRGLRCCGEICSESNRYYLGPSGRSGRSEPRLANWERRADQNSADFSPILPLRWQKRPPPSFVNGKQIPDPSDRDIAFSPTTPSP